MNAPVEKVIAELDAHRTQFEFFCRSLSEEQLGRVVPNSTWIVKDFIAHLATIDVPVSRFFRSVHEDKSGPFRGDEGAPLNIDQWNDATVAERRERSVEEILEEAAKNRCDLKAVMAEFDQEDLDFQFTFGGDSKRSPAKIVFGQYLSGWCKHDPMHAVDMMRAVPDRLTPELEAWFSDPVVQGYQAQMNKA